MKYFHRSKLPSLICTTDSACEILGVSRSRVRQIIREGRLWGFKISERGYLLDYSQVRRLASKPRTTGRPRCGAKKD